MTTNWHDLRGQAAGDDGAEFATEAPIVCPWCGADTMIRLDPGGGSDQVYVEDCQVCCRPWRLRVTFDALGAPQVEVRVED